MSWARWFRFGVPDAIFGLVLLMVLIGGRRGFLSDPGTFWHVQLGREILRTGHVPRHDTFTFTRELQPWVDQSWLFDAGLAALVDRFGWPAPVVLTALLLATLYGALTRSILRAGVSPAIAFTVVMVATAIASIHFLVRPHIFTFIFVFLFLNACRLQHERGGWHVASLPLLMVLWANLHGGFLAGPIIVVTAGCGDLVSGPWDGARKRNAAKFAAAFVLCTLAPLLNPYGIGLYRHVGNLLVSSGVTEMISEYQPMPFGQTMARPFEWVILALIALPAFGSRRLSRYELAHILVWLHFSLASVRHAPLFALVMAPALGYLLDGLPLSVRSARWSMEWTPWPAVVGLTLVVLAVSGVPLGELSRDYWPLDALPALNGRPLGARLFHEQDWGGFIEAESSPRRRTYLDDRFELFGKEAIVEYLDVMQGGPQWDIVRDRERIDLVWVRPDRGLARRLEADAGWRVVHRDAVSVLFERIVPRTRAAAR